MFHIFRNTPLGRETLLQSIYFCKAVGAAINIYVPVSNQFVMHFDNGTVKINLDTSYLTASFTALSRATQLAVQEDINPIIFSPQTFNASYLPVIPTNMNFMCCPQSISVASSKIGFGHIGPNIKKIVKFAQFPVLIASPGYKKWRSIAVCYGGSPDAVNALRLGLRIGRASGFPLDVFTQIEKEPIEIYEKVIQNQNLEKEMDRRVKQWHVFKQNSFEENLYKVPHDALVVLSVNSYNPIKTTVLGSKIKKIRSTLPNNLLIAGPNYREPNSSLPAWFPSVS